MSNDSRVGFSNLYSQANLFRRRLQLKQHFLLDWSHFFCQFPQFRNVIEEI